MGHDMIARHPRVWSSATPDENHLDSSNFGNSTGNGDASGENHQRPSLPLMEEHEEFIKTAGIIKKPGIPLGLRYLF